MSEKVRFGIVGCGRIGKRHAQRIAENPRAELVAVCDTLKEGADSLAKEYDIKAVYDVDSLISMDEVDVVNVCTPSGLHTDISIKALQGDKHVLCEKPMTLNVLDAESIINAEKQSKGKFFLVKQNKYNPPIKALKNAVYNKQLGELSLLNCNVSWNRRKSYYEESGWRGTMAFDGGALMTQCSHFLDLMVWIGGPVKQVHAYMDNHSHPEIETEDTGTISLLFENGAIGSLTYTMNVYEKNLEGNLTVVGDKGTIKVGGEYLNTLDHWAVENVEKPDLKQGNPANDYGSYKGSMSNHDFVIENVVSVLLDGEKVKTNSSQGKETMEVMQAAYISALKGKIVDLPLTGEDLDFKLDEQPPLSGNKKSV